MKIVKNNYKSNYYNFNCKRCNSVLEITQKDIKITRFSYWRTPPYIRFTCPCCGKDNSIPRDHEILKNY